MERALFDDYVDLQQEIQSVDDFIKQYREFMHSVQPEYSKSEPTKNSSTVEELFSESIDFEPVEVLEDNGFEHMLGEEISSLDNRELRNYCKSRIKRLEHSRDELEKSQRQIIKEIGFYRHPKKDSEI